MGEFRSQTVRTFIEFAEVADRAARSAGGPCWFRGCCTTDFRLTPGLYRHPKIRGSVDEVAQRAEFFTLEHELLAWFKQRSAPYRQRDLGDCDWEWLFFMQHYRVPTRLLDWTESPYVALYFALTEAPPPKASPEAAVWALRPLAWNRTTVAEVKANSHIPSPGDEALNAHGPESTRRWLDYPAADADQLQLVRPLPVAMHGTHNTLRIALQRGAFVAFGAETADMKTIYESGGFAEDALTRIDVPAKARGPVLQSLLSAGITDSVIFPDLEGVAREARRSFGFGE